jgi:hypothetical protein
MLAENFFSILKTERIPLKTGEAPPTRRLSS